MNRFWNGLTLAIYLGLTISTLISGDQSQLGSAARSEELRDSKSIRTDQLLSEEFSEDAPGASVAVSHRGKVIYSRGFGLANLEYGIPNTSQTVFHVASISKQFTGFAIAMLVENGIVSLDQDIRTVLPWVPDFGQAITIRHLLHHMSGLRDQWKLLVLAGWRPDDVVTQEQIVKLVRKQKELNFSPGERFQYSNTNYTLLALIVEAVTGKRFSDWATENLFQPLEMQHSLFYDDHERLVMNRAYSYARSSEGFIKQKLNYSTVGATSLFATTKDLLRWSRNFKEPTLGNEAVINRTLETIRLPDGSLNRYAFGQEVTTYKGLRLVAHGGADAGFRAYLARFPEQEVDIVVLGNFKEFNARSIAMRVAEIVLADAIEKASKLEGYDGTYRLTDAIALEISSDHGALAAQIVGVDDVHRLELVEGERYQIPTLNSEVIFGRSESGEVSRLEWLTDEASYSAPRMSVGSRGSDAQESGVFEIDESLLAACEGKYRLSDPFVFTVWLDEEELKGRISGKQDEHRFVPVGEGEFQLPTLDASVRFESDTDGRVTRMLFVKGGRTIRADRLTNVNEAIVLSDYVGEYWSRELSTNYTFALEGDGLVAHHSRHSDIPISFLGRDLMRGARILEDIQAVRDADGRVIGIKVTSGPVENLYFERIN